jgi:hypothetical protein
MSSGLYSGVSGLALGVGLYKDVSGLWSGASGLDAGFDGPSLSLNFLSGTLDPRITFTRASTATFVGSNGLIQSAAINAPRFDYDPVTLTPRGLLIEEARTNLLTYSEQFDNAAWVKSSSTVTANAATAPDGTTTADTVTALSSTGFVSQSVVFTGDGDKSISVFVKAGTSSTSVVQLRDVTAAVTRGLVTLTWAAGVLSGVATVGTLQGIDSYGNGWYRVRLLATGVVAANTNQVRAQPDSAAGTGTLVLWGAQAENGAFATSYIPTVASTVARSADVASMTGTNFSSWYNQSEGTFVTSWTALGYTTTNMVFAVTNGGTADVVQQFLNSTTAARFTVRVAGVGLVALDATVNLAIVNKVANAYKVDDFASVANGGVVATDTTGTLPAVTRMEIGSRLGTLLWNGHIRTLIYFNTRFSDTALQQATV